MSTFFPRYDMWVKSALGPAVPGSQVYVCTQPANTTQPLDPTTGRPITTWKPSPLANIYSDPNGLVPITQPLITDGFGHADFYTLSGTYTVLVLLGAVVQQVYPDQSLGVAGTGSTLVLQTNGVNNGNQALQNLHSSDGTIVITDDGVGNVNLQANGALISRTAGITYTIDGGGVAPTTGAKGQITLPTAFNITGVYLTSDVAGSCVIDIKTCSNAGFPGSLTSITASDKPTLSSSQFFSDTALTGWTTALAALSQLQFVVNSASTLTRINITLTGTVTG